MRKIPSKFPIVPPAETFTLAAAAFLLCQSRWLGAFAYEFCFILGITAAVVSTAGTSLRLSWMQKSRPLGEADFGRALMAGQVSLLAPLAVALIFSLKIPVCRYGIGAAWFVLLPMTSSLFGSACGVFANRKPRTPLRALGWAFFPTALFSAITLLDLATGPQVSFLHPAFGYFAGPIYDEWIPVGAPVVTHRIWTAALALWIAAAPRGRKLFWKFSGMFLFGLLFAREGMGWFHGKRAILAELHGRAAGKFTDLHYDPAALSTRKAGGLLHALDMQVERIAREIDLDPTELKKIGVFIYPDARTKRRLTGAGQTEIGNPMQRAVHLTETDPGSEIFPHELTHLLAAPYGVPGLGLSFRAGLLEGLATAMQRYSGDLSVHEWAKAMRRLGLLPDLAALMSPASFWSQAPTRAYLAAGSFCRWLIDARGVRAFMRVYRGGSFEETYGEDVSSLIQRWRAFLDDVSISPEAVKIAETRLKAAPISERRCPHDVAQAMEDGRDCLKKSDADGAREAFTQAWEFSGHAPFTALQLARVEAMAGRWKSVERLGSGILRGDAAVARGEMAEAERRYSALRPEEMEDGARLSLTARLRLLEKHRFDLLGPLITKGPASEWARKVEMLPAENEWNAVKMYAAWKSLDRGDGAAARVLLNAVTDADLGPLDPVRWKLEARTAEASGDHEGAIHAYRKLKESAGTEGLRLFCDDQTARLR